MLDTANDQSSSVHIVYDLRLKYNISFGYHSNITDILVKYKLI